MIRGFNREIATIYFYISNVGISKVNDIRGFNDTVSLAYRRLDPERSV